MNTEPTLTDLEDQVTQEDLEVELSGIQSDLGTARVMMRMMRKEEQQLMARRSWIRTQLRLLRAPTQHVIVQAESAPESPIPSYVGFNGTTEPMCPDCTHEDD